jgi:oligoendopeptidase F
MSSQELRWKLEDIIPKGKFEQVFAQTEAAIGKFRGSLNSLAPDMPEASFREVMQFNEQLSENLYRLGGYCSLWEATDLKSQDAKLLKSRTDTLSIKYSDAAIPILHWLKGLSVEGRRTLDDVNAERLFASYPDLAYVLRYMRSLANHTLAQGEERILSRKRVTGSGAMSDLYDVIVDGFEYTFRPRGQKPKSFKAQEPLRKYFSSPKATEREAAYRAVLAPYQQHISTLFLIYQAIVKDWVSDAELRKHPSPIAMRNVYNHVPDRSIEILLAVTERNVGLFQEFFRVKAKLLKMKKLRRYDVLAPLEVARQNTPLDQAHRLVIDTFKAFSPGFAAKAESVFQNHHLDSHPRPGKRSGAFCSNVTPKIVPYVLMNYTGSNASVSTLAHELGHAVHDLYASGHTVSAAGPTLPLAETASTIAEVIVFERMLATVGSAREKRAMLLEKLVDSFSTIVRQAYFIKFELEAHRRMTEGVKADDLCQTYFGMLKQQFGGAVELADEFRFEWAYIPHIFHTPFYCYAYSFGNLLSLALYARYKKEGPGFVPSIEKILAYGGSQSPELILKEVGIDMSDPNFWQGSFQIIRGWLDELARLA